LSSDLRRERSDNMIGITLVQNGFPKVDFVIPDLIRDLTRLDEKVRC
jgi:hypothetical protein